ncbi:MAG TPA: histidine kinase [Streptosporangiaceae bacterium]
MRTTSPRPPLTKRLRPRHWAAIDWVVAAGLGLILWAVIRKSLVQVTEVGPDLSIYRPVQFAGTLTLPLVVISVLAVALRRRRPVFMLGLLLSGSAVAALLSGKPSSLVYFLPVAYVLYLIASTYETKRVAARVLVAVFVTLLLDNVLVANSSWLYPFRGAMVPVFLCVVIAWSTGYIVRQRRRYAIGLQEEAASKAVAEERLRIARELHDVVAHSMSVIAVQAGYGQYVIDSQPRDARAALGAIQATSREALDEMRRMLGALRQADQEAARSADQEAARSAGQGPSDTSAPVSYAESALDGGVSRPTEALGALAALFRPGAPIPAAPSTADTSAAPLFPAPGLDDLDRLLNRTASAGVQVELRRKGIRRTLPPSIDLSAYRIIQEALTNVVKHAHASKCNVLIDYGELELIVRVTDSGADLPVPALAGAAAVARGALADPLPGGHGIIGMRERVSLLGGEFSAGPLPGYGFEVTARIPLPPGGDV